MKNFTTTYLLSFFFIFLLSSGCSSIKSTEKLKFQDLPQQYTFFNDTANIANLKWHHYFSDAGLINLIETAIANNLDLSVAFQKIEMARARVRFLKGLSYPMVTLNGSAGGEKFGKYTMDGAGNQGVVIYKNQLIPEFLPDYYAGLQTSWELDLWGKIKNNKKAALSRFLATIEGKNWVLTSLISEVASNYYDLLALDNEIEIIRETQKLQDSAFKIVMVQKQAGVANQLAVKQFEAQLFNSKELEIETIQRISECENNLNLLLNRFPQSIPREKKLLINLIPQEIKTGVPGDLLKNRPDVRQREFELMASKADVKAARAAFFPLVNITGTMGYEAFKPSVFFSAPSLAYHALGSLTAPLINQSAIRAEFKITQAAQVEALCNYQKSILNGYIEVYNQLVNFHNRSQLLDMKSKEVEILTTAAKSSIELFKTGRANYLEVITVQQNILKSKLDLIQIQKQQCLGAIGVYKALGGGWK